jgi:CO/xanthine dehydrogenase FAD-binding subunit
MIDFDYLQPTTADELASMLARTQGRVVAGGTDILPRMRRGQFVAECLVDISRLADLRFVRAVDGRIEIGALTTFAELEAAALLQGSAPALVQAAASVGCPQTRQRGTLGGNLANASPAADSAPPLLVLDADVTICSAAGARTVALRDFFAGPGKPCLEPGEYIHAVSFCCPTGRWGAEFAKLGKRSGMAISVASAAASLELDGEGLIRVARVAFGSVAPTPVRSPHAEAVLIGQIPSEELFWQAGQAALEDIQPIGDIRASREYRLHAAPVLAQRVLAAACRQAQGRPA